MLNTLPVALVVGTPFTLLPLPPSSLQHSRGSYKRQEAHWHRSIAHAYSPRPTVHGGSGGVRVPLTALLLLFEDRQGTPAQSQTELVEGIDAYRCVYMCVCVCFSRPFIFLPPVRPIAAHTIHHGMSPSKRAHTHTQQHQMPHASKTGSRSCESTLRAVGN